MSGLSHKIAYIYNKILKGDIVFGSSTLKEAYQHVREAGETRFGENDLYSTYTQWTPFQKELYRNTYAGVALADKTAGPGEASVAAYLINGARPDLGEDLLAQNYLHVITQMVNHSGPVTVDIYDPFTKNYYEVKEASVQKSVMVGKESRGLATSIYNRLRNDFFLLYDIYLKLTPTHKTLIEKHKPNFKKTLDEIFTAGAKYFNSTPGELARGAIMRLETESPTPKYFLIPLFFNDELLSDPDIKNVVPDAVGFIKDLYNVEEIDARIIDKNIRDYIEKKRIGSSGISEDPNAPLSDFLLVSQTTVFASPEKFAEEIQSYFKTGTPESQEALKVIFPNTGIFLVDQNKGFLYAGKEKLSSLLRIDNISKGNFKVVPVSISDNK